MATTTAGERDEGAARARRGRGAPEIDVDELWHPLEARVLHLAQELARAGNDMGEDDLVAMLNAYVAGLYVCGACVAMSAGA